MPTHTTSSSVHSTTAHKQDYVRCKDRRRQGVSYSSDSCMAAQKAQICPNWDLCPASHNIVEVLYRVDQYKSKFCQHLLHLNNCEYGEWCPFAHSEQEITTQLLHNLTYDEDFYIFHYKTVWCPFSLLQHDQSACVYAHSFQDYRRQPHAYNYSRQSCATWLVQNELLVRYEDNCQFACGHFHGQYELWYHPLYYKTVPCQMGISCQSGITECPFYHSQNDHRIIDDNVLSGLTQFVPRNRILAGTFKAPVTMNLAPRNNPMNLNTPITSTTTTTLKPDDSLDQLAMEFQHLMNNETQY